MTGDESSSAQFCINAERPSLMIPFAKSKLHRRIAPASFLSTRDVGFSVGGSSREKIVFAIGNSRGGRNFVNHVAARRIRSDLRRTRATQNIQRRCASPSFATRAFRALLRMRPFLSIETRSASPCGVAEGGLTKGGVSVSRCSSRAPPSMSPDRHGACECPCAAPQGEDPAASQATAIAPAKAGRSPSPATISADRARRRVAR